MTRPTELLRLCITSPLSKIVPCSMLWPKHEVSACWAFFAPGAEPLQATRIADVAALIGAHWLGRRHSCQPAQTDLGGTRSLGATAAVRVPDETAQSAQGHILAAFGPGHRNIESSTLPWDPFLRIAASRLTWHRPATAPRSVVVQSDHQGLVIQPVSSSGRHPGPSASNSQAAVPPLALEREKA